jgi:hypothetical protein
MLTFNHSLSLILSLHLPHSLSLTNPLYHSIFLTFAHSINQLLS